MAPLITVTVRPHEPSDSTFLRSLGGRAFAPYSRHPAGEVLRMVRSDGAETQIAEIGGGAAGFCVVRFERLRRRMGPWRRPVVAHLEAIAVEPAARRRGVGRHLLEAARRVAREHNAISMFLMTADENRTARRLFEAGGFQTVAQVPVAYAPGQPARMMMTVLLEDGPRGQGEL